MLEAALPAVVTVAVQTVDDAPAVFGFARTDGEDRSPVASAYARELDLSPYAGSGSGFIIERDGRLYAVTNAHVIDQADPEEIYVFSIDRRRYRMAVRGADTFRDVAVLEFMDPPGPEIATIPIHTAADLRIGTPVYAVGNPLGEFPYSVVSGIISGLNRTLEGFNAKNGYLQTDATLIWGNSGGPLIGPEGEVVGLNTRIHLLQLSMQPVPAPQINFALEGQHLARLVEDLIEVGRVERPFLGLVLEAGEPASGKDGIPVRLTETVPGSPAAGVEADLVGARIIAISGDSVLSLEDVSGAVERMRPEGTVRLLLERDGETAAVSFETGRLDAASATRLGRFIGEALINTTLLETEGPAGIGTVQVSDAATPPDHTAVYLPSADGWNETTEGPRRGEVLAYAGFIDEGSVVWRIDELKDVAAVARMILPTGRFLLVFETPDGLRVAELEIAPTLIL